MSLLRELSKIIEDSENKYKELLTAAEAATGGSDSYGTQYHNFFSTEKMANNAQNSLFYGDNLKILADGISRGWLREKLDMIYCDPPFFTQVNQGASVSIHSEICSDIKSLRQCAYEDTWSSDMKDYLGMLAVRLFFMRDALADTGSIFIHLDWHAVHEVKLIMDEIFGGENFINEIIWTYKSGGAAKHHFSRKHDTILFYSKSENYKFNVTKEKSYNRGLKPYKFKGVKEYRDELGWYTLVNQKDVFNIDMVGRSSAERLNYATQKPEALLAKLIESVTDEGDLCADFFNGSGTMAACAAALGRRFVGTDIGGLAVSNSIKRLMCAGVRFDVFMLPEASESTDMSGHSNIKHEIKEGELIITAYCEKASKMSVRKMQRGALERLLKEDSLALIDFWCMGKMDESGCFRADSIILRDRNGNLRVKSGLREGAAAVFDIFGNWGFTEV